MDEDFAFFIKRFGPETSRQHVPVSSMIRYRNKLPGQLLRYWEEYGWCGYADGLFWTVNPQDYEHILTEWLADADVCKQDVCHVIARGAFGELYVWGEKSGECLTITPCMSRYSHHSPVFTGEEMDFAVRVFFSSMKREYNDFEGLFDPALSKLGKLKADEMYALVPALALGGSIDLKNLEKVKIIEHLEFLSQLSPLTDWGFPEI